MKWSRAIIARLHQTDGEDPSEEDFFQKHSTYFYIIFASILLVIVLACLYALWRGPTRRFFPCCGGRRTGAQGARKEGDGVEGIDGSGELVMAELDGGLRSPRGMRRGGGERVYLTDLRRMMRGRHQPPGVIAISSSDGPRQTGWDTRDDDTEKRAGLGGNGNAWNSGTKLHKMDRRTEGVQGQEKQGKTRVALSQASSSFGFSPVPTVYQARVTGGPSSPVEQESHHVGVDAAIPGANGFREDFSSHSTHSSIVSSTPLVDPSTNHAQVALPTLAPYYPIPSRPTPTPLQSVPAAHPRQYLSSAALIPHPFTDFGHTPPHPAVAGPTIEMPEPYRSPLSSHFPRDSLPTPAPSSPADLPPPVQVTRDSAESSYSARMPTSPLQYLLNPHRMSIPPARFGDTIDPARFSPVSIPHDPSPPIPVSLAGPHRIAHASDEIAGHRALAPREERAHRPRLAVQTSYGFPSISQPSPEYFESGGPVHVFMPAEGNTKPLRLRKAEERGGWGHTGVTRPVPGRLSDAFPDHQAESIPAGEADIGSAV